MSTILGGFEPRSQEEREKEDKALDVARIILSGWLRSYTEGEIIFAKLCQNVRSALAVEDVPDFMRWKLLGQIVDKALASDPPKRGRGAKRGRSLWLGEIAHGLVELAHEREGLPRNRIGNASGSAYQRAADILQVYGIRATAATVEKARSEWLQHAVVEPRKSKTRKSK